MATIDDFQKLDIRIGKITSAEKVEGSDKLLKLIFDFGAEQRQIIAGIALSYPEPEKLIGKEMPVIVNLEPKMLRGLESQGMILAASDENGIAVLHPDKEVAPGSVVK